MEGVPHEVAALQRCIEMTDRQIDALVYKLYGLTEAEIKVVEGVWGSWIANFAKCRERRERGRAASRFSRSFVSFVIQSPP